MNKWTVEEESFIKDTQNMLAGEAYNLYCRKYNRSYQAFAVKRSKMGCSNSATKKLRWKPEYNECVMATKGMNHHDAYIYFQNEYGNIFTATAFNNQRSRLGISEERPHASNKKRKLYDESIKHGYIYIKVAQPNIWISKARWVWEETHPGEITSDDDNFIFLDGNVRNFSPYNIERINIKERTLFIQAGGTNTNPEITKLHLLLARCKLAQLDLGERAGIVYNYGNGRRFKNKNKSL